MWFVLARARACVWVCVSADIAVCHTQQEPSHRRVTIHGRARASCCARACADSMGATRYVNASRDCRVAVSLFVCVCLCIADMWSCFAMQLSVARACVSVCVGFPGAQVEWRRALWVWLESTVPTETTRQPPMCRYGYMEYTHIHTHVIHHHASTVSTCKHTAHTHSHGAQMSMIYIYTYI